MLTKEKQELQALRNQGYEQVSMPLSLELLSKIFSLKLDSQGNPILVMDLQDLAGIEIFNSGDRFSIRSNNNLYIDSNHEKGKNLHFNYLNRDGSFVQPKNQAIEIEE